MCVFHEVLHVSILLKISGFTLILTAFDFHQCTILKQAKLKKIQKWFFLEGKKVFHHKFVFILRTMKTRLLLHHVSKDRNIETLQNLSSNFFSLDELVLVGRRKDEKLKSEKNEEEVAREDNSENNVHHCQSSKTKIRSYKYFRESLEDLQIVSATKENNNDEETKKHENSSKIQQDRRHILVGIEIEPNAVPAHKLRQTIQEKFPNCESVTLMPGNEGAGLLPAEKEPCDLFVYVQQFFRVATVTVQNDEDKNDDSASAAGGAGSLNVATSVAVTLSQFFHPSSSSSSTNNNSKHNNIKTLQIVPVLPFSVEHEKSRRVHFLCRPCTAFGSNFVAIVCPTHKVFMGDKGNRSSFGKNMNSEVHCPIESYISTFQALRDIRERTANMMMMLSLGNSDNNDATLVVGIEVRRTSSSSSSFSQQLEEQLLPALYNSKANNKKETLAILFPSTIINENDDGVGSSLHLSDSDRKQCDVILTLPVDGNDVGLSSSSSLSINLPCLLSIVLHRLCLFFDFSEGAQREDDESIRMNNKFVVAVKQKIPNQRHQQSNSMKKEAGKNICPLLMTAADEEEQEKERQRREKKNEGSMTDEEGDSLFGGLLSSS